jgi:HEPN domain-containing protein
MKKQVKNWLNSALDDLNTIKKIGNDETLTNMIAFHAEQAIEKSLKAILEKFESKVPRIHNVIKLKELTEKHVLFDVDKQLLLHISEVYSDARYPSDLGLIPTGKPSVETAKLYENFAESIYNIILEKLNTSV